MIIVMYTMSDENDDKIIIGMRVRNFPNLYQNVNKYCAFINHLLAEQTEAGFTLEKIDNGPTLYLQRSSHFSFSQPQL